MTIDKMIIRDVEKAKKKLIAKAKRTGLWENFGQKEIRKLEDKYSFCRWDSSGCEIWDNIANFNQWCMNFDLSDLKGI